MGEEMADSVLRTNATSTVSVRIFYMPHSYYMGQTDGFTSPPKEGMLWIFMTLQKNPTASAGYESANLGTRGQHANH
jgi:hypothetical protein